MLPTRYLYLSQPAKKDKEQEIRIVKKAIMDTLKNESLLVFKNNIYEWTPNNYPTIDKFIPTFDDYLNGLVKRIQCIKASDYFIFVDQWDNFPECKIDHFIINELNDKNIMYFRLTKDESDNTIAVRMI